MLSRDDVVKHWLLNLAINCPIHLPLLFPSFRSGALNARAIPHCPGDELARGLLDLFRSGMVTLSSESQEDDVTSHSGVSRVLDRFLALPTDHKHERFPRQPPAIRVSFALTALGGEIWEKVAEPDWTRLLDESSDLAETDICTANRDLLMAYMGWYEEINEARILTETAQWNTHKDFAILYWKRLPLVHHVNCRLEVKPPSAAPDWVRDRYSSATRWYRKPWELSGWPSD
jgi:hypothetical protein